MRLSKWTMVALAGSAALVLLAKDVRAQTPAPQKPGQASAQSPAPTAPLAALVNGEQITTAEIEAVVCLFPSPPTALTDAQRKQMRLEALDMLVDDALIRQFLTKNVARVDPAEVNKELDKLLAGLKVRNLTLQDFLRDTHQTEAHLRQDIVKKLQWDIFVKQHAPEDVLKRYHQDNRDYYDQVTVQASHILLRLSPGASEGERTQSRNRLVALRQQIVSGQIEFAEAAKKYSQCQTAPTGGDIGFFRRKWAVDEPIAQAAFALKVGEVSDVVQSDYGLHLLKVTGRKPGQPSNYDAIKNEVRENFAMELWHNILVQQRKVAKIETRP